MSKQSFEDFVLIAALENAINYSGKANPKALIGKCMPNFPEMKSDMGKYMGIINKICDEVNSMKSDDQSAKLKELNPNAGQKKTEKKEKPTGLPELEGVKGKIRTRFAPAPSGYLHMGHAYNVVFNYEYVKKYGGKFVLRIEDTNPENIKKENYDQIIEDVKWLTDDGVDEEYIQSERIDIFYEHIEKLLKNSDAYVCLCDSEDFKKFNDNSEACPHRDTDPEVNLELFEDMKTGKIKDGEGAIRFKADLKNKNPALRDFPIGRVNTNKHAMVGTKYKLWPMYNLCAAVDDSLMKMDYIIRGKDGEINGVRQDMIKDALGLKKCNYFHIGRVQVEGVEVSKTKIAKMIEDKKITGWDDPRVPTLVSYRKRGYKAEAFRKMIVAGGISKRDSKITIKEYHKSLDFFNKQILDPICARYYFVSYDKTPKKVYIDNWKELPSEIEIAKHPENPKMGSRKLKNERGKFYVDEKDFERMKEGQMIRLKNFGNFKVKEKDGNHFHLDFVSKEFDRDMKLDGNIQFVPTTDNDQAELVMSDNTRVKGFCESGIKDENMQFERIAFVRFDGIEKKKKIFYFTHR